jgi:hypothetical protein
MAKSLDQRQPVPVARTKRHGTSPVTFALVMAGIAAFFIAGIAAAFIYAKDTNPVQQAAAPLPPPAVYEKAPAETTGAGAGQQ